MHKNSKNIGKQHNINLKWINEAIKGGFLPELAIFLFLKRNFGNGCFYHYKSRMNEISQKAGVSERTLYRYFNKLKLLGLVRVHSENLILQSLKTIRGNTTQKSATYIRRGVQSLKTIRGNTRLKCKISIKKTYSIKAIEALLIAKILENRGKQQAYKATLREAKRRFNTIPYEPKGEAQVFAPSFSLRTIAKITKTSEKQALSVIKRLNDLGVIKTEHPQPKLIAKNVGGYVPEMSVDTAYRFVFRNNLYEIYGSRHEFLEYPILKKPISLKKYVMLLTDNVLPKRSQP